MPNLETLWTVHLGDLSDPDGADLYVNALDRDDPDWSGNEPPFPLQGASLEAAKTLRDALTVPDGVLADLDKRHHVTRYSGPTWGGNAVPNAVTWSVEYPGITRGNVERTWADDEIPAGARDAIATLDRLAKETATHRRGQ